MSGPRDMTLPSALNGTNGKTRTIIPTEEQPAKRRAQPGNKHLRDEPDINNANLDVDPWEEYNALKELLTGDVSRDTLAGRTEVNEAQIVVFSQARELARYYGLPILDNLVDHMLRFSISKGRKSRKEFVQSFQMAVQGQEAQPGMLERILGPR